MKTDRAIDDTPPRPAWTALFRWIARATQVSLFRFDEEEKETDPETADLWLMLMASDPEGTWHAWPNAVRRPPLDESRDT